MLLYVFVCMYFVYEWVVGMYVCCILSQYLIIILPYFVKFLCPLYFCALNFRPSINFISRPLLFSGFRSILYPFHFVYPKFSWFSIVTRFSSLEFFNWYTVFVKKYFSQYELKLHEARFIQKFNPVLNRKVEYKKLHLFRNGVTWNTKCWVWRQLLKIIKCYFLV